LVTSAAVGVPSGTKDPFSGNDTAAVTVWVKKLLAFHTLVPCRLADTRTPVNGPAIVSGSTRTFVVAGLCGVPSTASAVSVNVTVTAPSTTGHLRLFPTGLALPPISTINFSSNQTRANNAVVVLGSAGCVSAFDGQAAGNVHMILDVNGYFE
jgi:hypothetical protein